MMTVNVSSRKLSGYSPQQRAAALILASDLLANPPKDPHKYHAGYLRILDKRKRLVPLSWNRAQAHFHAHRTGRDLVLKARQLGFSTYIQGEMFRRTVTETRATITMAHDDDTTQKLREMADRFWENHPRPPRRKYANATKTTYPDKDSGATIATAGSKHKGRGGTYTDFHGSEVAFWPDAERIIAGAMEGGGPDVILESTPNGAQGHFYDLCMEALSGDSVWTLHFYPWWWDADYRLALSEGEALEYTEEEQALVDTHGLVPEQIKWRREKKRALRDLFAQEYPEDPYTCFLTSGRGYFGNLSHVYTAPLDPVRNMKHKHAAGLDFGQTNDWTVLSVIDVQAKRQVDMLRINRLSWGEQRARILATCKKWGITHILAEANSIGGVNIEELVKAGLGVQPFTTTNQSKADIMSDLHEGLHEGGLTLQDHAPQKHELNSFVSSQTSTGLWRLAAEGQGHDDTVIALALAWQAAAHPVWHMAGVD